MAELDLSLDEPDAAPPKKDSMVGFIIGIVVLTVVAVGAGWFLGGFFVEKKPEKIKESAAFIEVGSKKEKDKKGKDDEKTEKSEEEKTKSTSILRMEPILVALRKSNNAFMRLELALVFYGDPSDFDEEHILRLHSDLSAFARTVSLRSISGPSGYIHFREDIVDRARLASEGKINDVLILSMVAE